MHLGNCFNNPKCINSMNRTECSQDNCQYNAVSHPINNEDDFPYGLTSKSDVYSYAGCFNVINHIRPWAHFPLDKLVRHRPSYFKKTNALKTTKEIERGTYVGKLNVNPRTLPADHLTTCEIIKEGVYIGELIVDPKELQSDESKTHESFFEVQLPSSLSRKVFGYFTKTPGGQDMDTLVNCIQHSCSPNCIVEGWKAAEDNENLVGDNLYFVMVKTIATIQPETFLTVKFVGPNEICSCKTCLPFVIDTEVRKTCYHTSSCKKNPSCRKWNNRIFCDEGCTRGLNCNNKVSDLHFVGMATKFVSFPTSYISLSVNGRYSYCTSVRTSFVGDFQRRDQRDGLRGNISSFSSIG